MKRLKEWEEEKMVLEEGLAALRMAQDWYLQRSALLQEKLKYGPGPGASGMNSEAVQVGEESFFFYVPLVHNPISGASHVRAPEHP